MSPLQHYSMLPGKSQSHLQEYLLLSENHLECLSLPLRINVCMRVISRSSHVHMVTWRHAAHHGVQIQLLQLTCTYSQFPPPLRQQSEMLKFITSLMVYTKASHTESPLK